MSGEITDSSQATPYGIAVAGLLEIEDIGEGCPELAPAVAVAVRAREAASQVAADHCAAALLPQPADAGPEPAKVIVVTDHKAAATAPGQAAYEAHAAMLVPQPWRWDQLDDKLRAAWEAAAQAAVTAAAAAQPPQLADGYHDEFVNDILLNAPESYDGDDAAEVYAVRYVRHLEAEVARLSAAHPAPGGALSAVYRERARLVAFLAAVYPSVMLTDSADPDWPIVFIETPAGQLSWHIAATDTDLFQHVPSTAEPAWDGHTTDEKYERLAALIPHALDIRHEGGGRA